MYVSQTATDRMQNGFWCTSIPLLAALAGKYVCMSTSVNQQQHLCTELTVKKGKGGVKLLIVNPSQSYGASPAVWDHTVLAANQHK